jgi:CheY-like chemotaxis protein
LDGLQATAQIREASDEDVASLPIVAMTAFTMAGDRERCLDAGMDGYVGKPIDKQRLVSELQRLTRWSGVPSAA